FGTVLCWTAWLIIPFRSQRAPHPAMIILASGMPGLAGPGRQNSTERCRFVAALYGKAGLHKTDPRQIGLPWPLGDESMPFYEKGDVRIRYEEAGSGFPLLLVPGGGLNSRMSNWPNAVFNSMEIFKDEFRCITMDQRNANGGESSGPIPASGPWDAFADDQLGLMDHLGIKQFLFMGYCIGGCFAMKLMERDPERVVAGVLVQTVGHHPQHPDYMYNSGRDVWAPELLARRPDLSKAQIEPYLHDLYRVQPDFVYSVSRDFARSCQTPILVLPDEVPAHPLVSSVDIASLCPNAEITVFPWREPPEPKARTISRVRSFLRAHLPIG